jgi:hypothetical protein
MSYVDHVLAISARLEREGKDMPDRIVVSPAVWEALLHENAKELRYDAFTDTPRLVGLAIRRSPALASGFALFKGDKLLTAVL